MTERCTTCGRTFDDFEDVIFNSDSSHGPIEHIPNSKE